MATARRRGGRRCGEGWQSNRTSERERARERREERETAVALFLLVNDLRNAPCGRYVGLSAFTHRRQRCTTAATPHTRCRSPGVGPNNGRVINVTAERTWMCATFSVVPYTDTYREDAEPTDEQQHQESGQGMQLHREAAGRFGVHLHDSGQWGKTFTLFWRTCSWQGGWGVR